MKTHFMKAFMFCLAISGCLCLDSCGYDDEELVGRVESLESRVAKLEELCTQINGDIESLQALLAAVEERDYITSVTEIEENGEVTGYEIVFAKSDPITIRHGKDGKDGTDGVDGSDGEDGYVPVISVKKDKDNIYYWTLDGEWLTDEKGNKIKAEGRDGADGSSGHDGYDGQDGVTPKLKIENETWYVSYDNGNNWTELGSATGDIPPCNCPITDVTKGEESLIFTLAGGETVEVPYYVALAISFESTTVEAEAGQTTEVAYTLTPASDDVKVTAIGEGVTTRVADGKLYITAPDDFTEGKVLVMATDGNNIATVELTVKKIVITYIEYKATSQVKPDQCPYYLEDKSEYNGADAVSKIAIEGPIHEFTEHFIGGSFNNNLTWIKIPEGVTAIGGYTFVSCNNLEDIEFPATLEKIGERAFSNCKSLKEVDIPEGITKIENNTFEACYALTSVTFPNTLTEIGDYAFINTSLSSLTIPEGVTKIGYQAFKWDSNNANPTFETMTLPESLEEIGSGAFQGNGQLTTVTIPDNVKTIGKQAFSTCEALTSVIIGSGVTSIGASAFNLCEKLATVTCRATTPPACTSTSFMKDDSRSGEQYIEVIYVPRNSISAYEKATGWKEFAATVGWDGSVPSRFKAIEENIGD